MIRGAGKLSLIMSLETVDVFPDFSTEVCYSLFTLTSSTEIKNNTYLSLSGILQNKGAKIDEERYFVELVLEDVDYNALQYSLGEIASSEDDVVIYEDVTICPLLSTVFTDARIVAANETGVLCYDLTNNQIMVRVDDVGDVGNGFYFVDGSSNEITFGSEELGNAIKVSIPVTKQDVACIGGPNDRGEFYLYSFEGQFLTTQNDGPYTVVIPYLRRISAPVITLSGDAVTYTLRFEAVCGSGYERKPFRIYSPTAGVPLAQEFILLEDGDFLLQEDDNKILTENSN